MQAEWLRVIDLTFRKITYCFQNNKFHVTTYMNSSFDPRVVVSMIELWFLCWMPGSLSEQCGVLTIAGVLFDLCEGSLRSCRELNSDVQLKVNKREIVILVSIIQVVEQ